MRKPVQTLLNRVMSALRGLMGWYAPSPSHPDGGMTPSHGWLLPQPAEVLRRPLPRKP